MTDGSRLVRDVDERGISVTDRTDRAIDVLFDGTRVWSFWSRRDTEPDGGRGRMAAWPGPLARYLDGRTRLQVRDSASGEVHFDDEVAFGSQDRRIAVVNKQGHRLGIDKSGRLVPTFETRGSEDIARLVSATQEVLEALRSAGARPFVGYGTLLGAVREGAVLGHDSDADIAYVSEHSHPVDVVRESFRLQREVNRLGYQTIRYSGAAFKVRVVEADGFARGLDVFGGFLDSGRLYLMGEVGVDFEEEWLYPLGTAGLEGHQVPVPSRPEKLLEAMYGPGWRTPDPAFRFETSRRTKTALDSWFRGTRPQATWWQRRYAFRKSQLPSRGPSALARQARMEAAHRGATVLDVGAGKGADSLWLARQGVPVVAYDYVPHALDLAAATARSEGLSLEVRDLNLTEWRGVLCEGARLARIPGPRVVLAQHLLDATTEAGRQAFVRLCSMALRGGGTLYAQFQTSEVADVEWAYEVDMDELAGSLRAAGAREVTVRQLTRASKADVARVVAQWGS